MRGLVVVFVLTLAATPLLGDELFLKGGGRVTGAIVKETAEAVTVDIGAGNMTVPRSSIVRIEKTASPLQQYRAQAASLAPEDVEGWRKLGRSASTQGLTKQAREAFTKVKAILPDDPEANRVLGLVQLDGHWVTEKESYTARGFVLFEHEWMTPAERQAILDERQVRAEADQQALDAEIEADRAAQADQEAREAAEDSVWRRGPLDQERPWNDGYGYVPAFWPEGDLPGSSTWRPE